MLKIYRRIIFINVLVALAYWGVSHLNWMFFHKVGILPMPIWPAASVALIAGLYWGWSIAPALAAGTILANHYSLGATWIYASYVALMNTLGPLTAAWLVHRKDSEGNYSILSKLSWLIAASLFLAPAMTATGGIGSQWLLGMIELKDFSIKWLRWFMAHSIGTLLFVCPVVVFYPSIWQQKSDTGKNDWLERAGRTTLILTIGLALLLWFGESLICFLWFTSETVSLAENLFPIHSPHELLNRIFVSITILFAGGAISKLLKNLAESHKSLEQSNHALKESETMQHTLLANLPAGIIIVDPETKIIENVNNTTANMFGLTPEQITGKRCHSFLCPANEGSCPVCDLGQNVDNSEREMLCADRSKRPILKSVKKIQIKGKEKLLECFIDISEQKQAEQALRESEERLRREQSYTQLLLDTSPAYIVAIGFDGKTLMMNNSLLDAVEYTREEITGIDYLTTFVPEEDRELLSSVFQQLIEEKKATINENRIISKSGKIYLVEWHGRTVVREKGNIDFFVGFGIDITDRKKSEEEKRKLEDQLSQAQKMESVGRLAGGVAHDFNNMLNVILGYSALLLSEFGHDHPFFAYLDEIQNAAERSADLTRQLLAFARKQTIDPKVLNLNETIDEMLNMLRRLIGEDISLAWKPHSDLWQVNIDPAQIDQILVNLMVNSRDAIEGVGKITIETYNVIFNESYCAMHVGFTMGEYVMLAISDTGCGMDEETLAHIYEPFYTTKTKGKGIGLGMATVYGIIKQNNGFINVYTEPARGTTIKIYLPRHTGTASATAIEDTEETAIGGDETILLVEDEPATLKLGQIILEGLGYTILTANTPVEAIRIAEEKAGGIHLLITDVVMPEMNGRDLANKLLSTYPDLKILFMSGYTANVIAHHGILDEGVHFIQKPFSTNNLAAKAREALDG